MTVNDVMRSVMSDVLGEEIKSKKPDKMLSGRVRRVLNHFMLSPIAYFMYAPILVVPTTIDSLNCIARSAFTPPAK